MPRPTTAQLAYGSLTVILSTFAILLLTDASSGAGVVAVAAAGLVLGLAVAAAVATPRRGPSTATAVAYSSASSSAAPAVSGAVSAAVSASGSAPSATSGSTRTHGPVPRARLRGGVVEPRVGEHSLRR